MSSDEVNHTALTRPLSALARPDLAIAGAKGASLGEMTRAGLPIPPGFVLVTAAYDAFVQQHALQPQILELARAFDPADGESTETASAHIRRLFEEHPIPQELIRAILDARASLDAESLAVRSSATAEDLPSASFAGQQETLLNVRGDNALLDAVKQCWSSLWTARAMVYRRRQTIDPADVSLAVVVQALVPADAAGILFTASPVDGRRDQMLINAAWGLGEAIVGGHVTPDTIVVNRNPLGVESRETSTKTVMTVRTENGTQEAPVPGALRSRPVLDDAAALELSHLGGQIEELFGQPMDIEWAKSGSEIAILQARPITSLPPAPLDDVRWEPVAPNTIWMRRQIVEHMPEPLSPLFEDLYLHSGMDRALDELMQAMNAISGTHLDLQSMIPQGFAATINGYAYTTGSFRATPSDVVEILKIYSRLNHFLTMPQFDWERVVLPTYQRRIALWSSIDPTRASDEQLLQGIGDLAAADISYWFGSAANLGLSRIMDSSFNRFLNTAPIRRALPTPRPSISAFLRGFDSKALDAQADMEAIAAEIRSSEDLRKQVLEGAPQRLPASLRSHPDGIPILAAIDRYMAAYGHQIYNLDFADPTQIEDPLPIFLSLKNMVMQPPEEAVRERQRKMAAEREALVSQLEDRLDPLSARLFRRVWKWVKKYAPYRESVMFYMGAGWPTLRRLTFELGGRFTDAGIFEDPEDIYFLTAAEIEEVSKLRQAGAPRVDLSAKVLRRRTLRTAQAKLTPPPKIPAKASMKFGPLDLSMFDPTPDDEGIQGSVLAGYAVSAGTVTAQASVVRSQEDFGQMRPGTVLVCTTTTPAWTPLFSQAVGLVTDIGGALAHGSIIAREYGIPAVMGTGVATERIESGDRIQVDGDRGRVTLLNEVDTAEAERMPDPDEKRPRIRRRLALLGSAVGLLVLWRRKRSRNKRRGLS